MEVVAGHNFRHPRHSTRGCQDIVTLEMDFHVRCTAPFEDGTLLAVGCLKIEDFESVTGGAWSLLGWCGKLQSMSSVLRFRRFG